MKCNLAVWDRIFRFIAGCFLVAYLLAGGPFWAVFGLYLLITAAWGLCPIYGFFKFRTLRDSSTRKNG
ncbi:MAG: DUF2892 domain-containing protein [Bdellovibrionota bacterium]